MNHYAEDQDLHGTAGTALAPVSVPVSAPVSAPVTGNGNDALLSMLAGAVKPYLQDALSTKIDEQAVHDIVAKAMAGATLVTITKVEVSNAVTGETHDLGIQHKSFPELLALCQTGENIWLVGPAGSGKTMAAASVAKALGRDFQFCGALDNPYGLLGYRDAKGEVVRTPFREVYEHGGVFLQDEVDASSPSAVLALNAALANGHCAFPDGRIERHPNTIIIAAANTWGLGATNEYIGRAKMDAAFLDRFITLPWDYDNEFEVALSGNAAWALRVQAVRAKVRSLGIKVLITPRASIRGGKLLASGISQARVEELILKGAMTADQWNSVKGA